MKTFLRLVGIVFGFGLFLLAGALYPLLQNRWHDLETALWQRKYFAVALLLVPIVLFSATLLQDAWRPHIKIGAVFPLTRGPRGARVYLRDLPGTIRAAALVFLIGALMRPINVKKDERAEDKGIDIMLVMDLSGSMRAILDGRAEDLPGAPTIESQQRLTRLDTAKIVVKDFVARRKGDRIGIVVFAKNAYILSPPTLDYPLLTKLVSRLTLRVIDDSGTAIGDGLTTGLSRLRRSDAQSKVVILLTDGDNNAGEVSPDFAAQLAKDHQIKVYTIQVGTGDEVDVEDGQIGGVPHYTRQRFPVNPALLKRISGETGGESYIATDGKGLADSMHSILNQLEKTKFEAPRSAFEDLFPLLLLPGVALVGLELLLRVLLLRRFP